MVDGWSWAFDDFMFIPSKAFADIARGDLEATAFMAAFYLWVHKQDDLIDRDKPVPVEHSVGFDLSIFHTFAKNEFFHKNADMIWPVIVTSALAYIASEEKKKNEDVLERITAQVLKSQYMDVFFIVAVCIGGFDHAVAMSRKYREYAFDVETPAPL